MSAQKLIQPINDELVQILGMSAAILRLDLLHPIVSGNKIFKLKHYLAAAKS
jgi:1-aminocyclopropane-1-carboxylate deaminase